MNKLTNEIRKVCTVPRALVSGNSVFLGGWTCGGYVEQINQHM